MGVPLRAGVMRKYHIDTIHKPTVTIKNTLFSKAKYKVDPLEKSGAIYSIKYSKHDGHYVIYIYMDKQAERPKRDYKNIGLWTTKMQNDRTR